MLIEFIFVAAITAGISRDDLWRAGAEAAHKHKWCVPAALEIQSRLPIGSTELLRGRIMNDKMDHVVVRLKGTDRCVDNGRLSYRYEWRNIGYRKIRSRWYHTFECPKWRVVDCWSENTQYGGNCTM